MPEGGASGAGGRTVADGLGSTPWDYSAGGRGAGRMSVQEGVETVDFGIEAVSFAASGDEFIDQSGALSLIFLWGDRFGDHDFSGAAGAVHFGGFAQGGEPCFAVDGGGGEAGAGSATCRDGCFRLLEEFAFEDFDKDFAFDSEESVVAKMGQGDDLVGGERPGIEEKEFVEGVFPIEFLGFGEFGFELIGDDLGFAQAVEPVEHFWFERGAAGCGEPGGGGWFGGGRGGRSAV